MKIVEIHTNTHRKGIHDNFRFAEHFLICMKTWFLSVAFWVTNPCRNTRKVKQTKMYVCTLEEFILVDLDTLLCKLEVICIGKCCSLYTITTMDEKG